MRKMLFIFVSCLSFMSIYAEDVKIFLTNTYFDNPYYLYKELDKSDTAIRYKGNAKKLAYSINLLLPPCHLRPDQLDGGNSIIRIVAISCVLLIHL
ncbi:MAG: hypothetical protein II973_08225, partial [Spirochaetaceae bacterium]|nr:hypothetical protein [Spirochaetaceae bacterium]